MANGGKYLCRNPLQMEDGSSRIEVVFLLGGGITGSVIDSPNYNIPHSCLLTYSVSAGND